MQIESGGRSISITHPNKVLFPESGIKKIDMAKYYQKIFDYMLPHMKDRALAMKRYPEGINEDWFFHKNVPDYFPDWIKTVKVKKKGGSIRQVVCNQLSTLLYIANQDCIEPHVWLSRIDNIHRPDKMIFDLDPSDRDYGKVVKTALKLKDFLEGLGLKTYVMTTGSEGLHVVVPLSGKDKFEEVREFSKQVVTVLEEENKGLMTTQKRKDKRGNKVFLDNSNNSYAQTSVAPYSLRARKGAPVATPLDWKEVNRKGTNPRKFTVKNIFRRLSHKKEPWKDIYKKSEDLGKAKKRLCGDLNL